MEKTFRMLNVGDVIYQAEIKNSQLQKNGGGISYNGYLIKEKKEISFYQIEFVITKLKFNYSREMKGTLSKTEIAGDKDITIQVVGNNQTKRVDTKEEDEFDININQIFYSTTKTALKECLTDVLHKKDEYAEKLKKKIDHILGCIMISSIELTTIDTKDEEEITIDAEEMVSMAL